jgi:hypothetical protein
VKNGLLPGLEEMEHSEEKIKHRGTEDACNVGQVLDVVDTERVDIAEHQDEANKTVDERFTIYFVDTRTYIGIIKALGASLWPIVGLCIHRGSMAWLRG